MSNGLTNSSTNRRKDGSGWDMLGWLTEIRLGVMRLDRSYMYKDQCDQTGGDRSNREIDLLDK